MFSNRGFRLELYRAPPVDEASHLKAKYDYMGRLQQVGQINSFPRREMTKQCGQPDVGPAGDISHGRIDSMLGDDVTRDCK